MAIDTSAIRPKRGGFNSSTETVITCTGDLTDPNFKRKFRSILKELRSIVCKGSEERLRVRKMEPWNSVRVTFSIGVEAAERLRALAEAGGEVLSRLGILSVQLPNGQVISVRVSTPSTPPNVVAPSASTIPTLVSPAGSSSGQQQAHASSTRFPFTSMAQASAIVSRETKSCVSQASSHYPPPPYPDQRPEVPQASPLLVNLLQTEQVASSGTPGSAGRPTAFTRPAPSVSTTQSGCYPPTNPPILSGGKGGLPPPPYGNASSSSSSLGVLGSPTSTQTQRVVGSMTSMAVKTSQTHQSVQESVGVCDNIGSSKQPEQTTQKGKTVQYLINPLTGVLEPMISSESESENETSVMENSTRNEMTIEASPVTNVPLPPVSPPLEEKVLVVPKLEVLQSPVVPSAPVVSTVLQRHTIPLNPMPQVAMTTVVIKTEPEEELRPSPVTPVATVVAQDPIAEPSPSEGDRPKGEEKIKLRLKIEKTESSFNQYKTSGESCSTNQYKTSGESCSTSIGSSSAEPRVPPLHISLRGRPAVVSRKEKRKKEESNVSQREKERETISTGTYEGTCQFPSEAEVASILRSMPTGGKLLNTTVTARRKRDKKKIYPRTVPRVEEKLKKGSGSLLKSVVKSAAKEARIMTAQRSSKPLQNKKATSPVLNNQSSSISGKPSSSSDLDFKATQDSVGNSSSVVTVVKFKENGGSAGSSTSGGSTGDDSGIESMDALSEKSPNQSTSPLRKEDLPKKKEKEVEEVVPIRLTPALYTYSNPERQREETPSPDHTEEERFGGKSLLEQLLIDIPNGDANERRTNSHRRSPEISPTIPVSAKRSRRPSESSSSDPPTPRPNKRKCSENACELIKACIDEGKRENSLSQVDGHDFSDDEAKKKEEGDTARLRLMEEKPVVRSTFNTRRSARQSEIREARPTRKSASQTKRTETPPTPAINANSKRRRNSKDK